MAGASGRRAEAVAALRYLLSGHRILGRRVRTPYGEVDVVCRRGDALVLLEVKHRRAGARRSAVRALRPEQARRLARASLHLRARSPWAHSVRLDLVAIDGWRVRIVRNALDLDALLPESARLAL